MRRKQKKPEAITKDDFYTLIFFFLLALIHKYPIILWIAIIIVVCIIIISLSKNIKVNKASRDRENSEEKLMNRNIEKINNIKIASQNQHFFLPQTIRRGIEYYNASKVTNYKHYQNKCTATVLGNESYNTKITFDKDANIVNATCTCPNSRVAGKFCKHIHASMLKYFDKINSPKESLNKFNGVNNIIEMCDDMEDKINDIKMRYDEFDDSYEELSDYEDLLEEYRNMPLNDLSDEKHNDFQAAYEELNNMYEELESSLDDELTRTEEDTEEETPSILDTIREIQEEERIKAEEEKERQAWRSEVKFNWGLTDYQMDLVERGDYEPCQFSGDDEEEYYEDDFYSEDEF